MVVESPLVTDAYMANCNEEEEEENNTSTSALRKNLTSAFDKHAEDNSGDSNNRNTRKRPPIAPVASKARMNPKAESDNKLLSVFLRIRPLGKPSSSKSSESTNVNTIEVIDKGADHSESNTFATTVRTYPPLGSNAEKTSRTRSNNSRKNSGYTSNDDDSVGSNKTTLAVKEYSFSQVFQPHSTQKEVYDNVAAPLVEGLFSVNKRKQSGSPTRKKLRLEESIEPEKGMIQGQSALLFAYGCTNAGKTHTMIGKFSLDAVTKELDEQCGILPRSLNHIFQKIEALGDNSRYAVQMSYLEIYNESIYDLLASYEDGNGSCATRYNLRRKKGIVALKLREDKYGRTYVHGLTKHAIRSVSEGLEIAEHAVSKRHSSSNNLNNKSSRSHCICQLELVCLSPQIDSARASNDSSVQCVESSPKYLWLVDLAGTERSNRTGFAAKSIHSREANLINISLMTLMRCLKVISDNQNSSKPTNVGVVPFRESKLTQFLKDHISGSSNSRTRMIVNVNPSALDYDETQQVLSYASAARTIKIDVAPIMKISVPTKSVPTKTERPKVVKKMKIAHPPKMKLASIVQKLSPKRTKQTLAKRKAELQSMRGAEASHDDSNSITELKGEIERLTSEKEEFRLKSEELSTKNNHLENSFVRKEAEIREEVVHEMENQIQEIEETFKEKLRSNRNLPTPMSCSQKIKEKRAEEFVESLINKVDECEDEMVRMRARHDEEVDEILVDLDAKTSDWEAQRLEYEKIICSLKEQSDKGIDNNGEVLDDEATVEMSVRDSISVAP